MSSLIDDIEEKFVARGSITHVIFDFDGILVDTERLYSKANEEVLMKLHGETFTNKEKALMMGKTKPTAVEALLKAFGLSDSNAAEKYMEAYDAKIAELFAVETKVLPGAISLVDHLHKTGIPLAICTGSDALEFQQKTSNTEIANWLEKIPLRLLCGSDPEITNCKPHPEPYLKLMKRFNDGGPASPENVLVFEDSVNGVRSALDAGCTVIMVPQPEFLPPNWEENEFRAHPNLAEILESLTKFQPQNYGLAAFS
ncbi:hypothetical protein ACQ4LE_005987 [Meloidogyne hapla]|uniref:HAD hydrolase, family IA, variant 3 n=1 Tax=Meloidogyne hapla TaxID=6305 RepID=A0A1I8AXU3_MELHA